MSARRTGDWRSRPRRRKAGLHLSEEPTDEELVRDWTLADEDRELIGHARGARNQLRMAVQLCVLRRHGRRLDDYTTVPTTILNHLGLQLDLPPLTVLAPAPRAQTEREQDVRIREHLGFRRFSPAVHDELDRFVEPLALAGLPQAELVARAEAWLLSQRVLLPAGSSLGRRVASARRKAIEATHSEIYRRLGEQTRRVIDQLLAVPKGKRRSRLFQFKEYPPEPKPRDLLDYIGRFRELVEMGAGEIDLEGIAPDLIDHLLELVRRYDVDDLKRFESPKRYAMVACFLAQVRRILLDHIVEMHAVYLTGMHRRAKNAFEKRFRELRDGFQEGLELVLETAELLLEPDRDRASLGTEVFLAVTEQELEGAVTLCRDFQNHQKHGLLDALRNRHSKLKEYLPAFLELPFEAEPGSEALLEAVKLFRHVTSAEVSGLPPNAPIGFVPKAWLWNLVDEDGSIDRRLWEIALAMAVRDALRSGDIYLADSRYHVSFFHLLYGEDRWVKERERAYDELALPREPHAAVARLREEFEEVAAATNAGWADNSFATIRDGRLRMRRSDALPTPKRLKDLRAAIETRLPRIRIEDLLRTVDLATGFTREFKPLAGYEPLAENLYATLLAVLVAEGTNLGLTTMANSTKGISISQLDHVRRHFVRHETLRAANRVLVDYHASLDFTAVWGRGEVSASDGQRFGIEPSSLLGAVYPRYFGYYDRAISLYTHTSDQYSVFAGRAISCSAREAIYVLDGLLENDTVLRPREHYADTHGYTDQLFGLSYLLGYSFMPRLRDLKDVQLYKLDRDRSYGHIDPILRFTIDLELIAEQWDQLVRVAASLKNRTAPAHVVLQRLVGRSPSDRLAKALTALGRVVKTIYILRYVQDEPLRRRIQLQLNRIEARHRLAQRLFFGNLGIFRTADYDEIMNKVSALSLLSNAVVVWNTVQMRRIVSGLRRSERISDEDLARVSPLAHKHVIPTGSYHFEHVAMPRARRSRRS